MDYIKWIRSKVGHEKVILVFAGGCLFDDAGRVLLQRRGTVINGDSLVGRLNLEKHLKKLLLEN